MEMKLKIKIFGPKVHGVGYRYFLMDMALDLGLQGFNARNRIEDGQQQVIVFVDGDDEAIADLRRIIEVTRPENARVSGISVSEYEGSVMDVGAYAQVCTTHQLHKAIPILLDMRDDIKEIKANTAMTPQILEEIKGLREDQPSITMRLRQMEQDIQAIKAQLKMP